MKLLSFSIPLNEQNLGFRSLKPGFSIHFHTLNNVAAMEKFSPFCFAGLNGSGKSNVLEALANIFYHLEICAARFLPASLRDEKNFKRTECVVDVFELEYLIGLKDQPVAGLKDMVKVSILKASGAEPIMKIQEYPFKKTTRLRPISFTPGAEHSAPAKSFLPDYVIGYSSGENELLSLPFIKSRLLHLDEYREATKNPVRLYSEPENSLIYIDSDMSQAVLLACLLFEDDKTLEPLRSEDNTGILGLRRFTIYLTYQQFDFQKDTKNNVFQILEGGNEEPEYKKESIRQVEKLKKCATSWYGDDEGISLDFFVDDATKQAFKEYFENAFELFQVFQMFYELNNHFVKKEMVEDVYRSKGKYTDWKIPVGSPGDDAFYFLDYYLIKQEKKSKIKFDLLLRDFSDGEHQFLHTTGICLMLKNKRALLLLDEPETHFNPSWRAKFIKILNDSIKYSGAGYNSETTNIYLYKDVLLTSHSPFIISDCMPDNVILFERNEAGDVTAKKVSELENAFNTYGTSVELILDRLFNYRQSIGDLANSEIENINPENIDSNEDAESAKELLRRLGESIEKDMVLARLNRISLKN